MICRLNRWAKCDRHLPFFLSCALQLYDKLSGFVTDFEREELTSKLQQTEDWLYEDGEDEIKSVYVAKLAELKKVSCSQHKADHTFGVDQCSLRSCLVVLCPGFG